MSKESAVLVLDISLPKDDDFNRACAICEGIIVDKMVYSSLDEVAVVLAGTSAARSTLHETQPERYHSIFVDTEVGRASKQALASVGAARRARREVATVPSVHTNSFDFVEALTVAANMLQTKTAGRKVARAIYLITDARHEVTHKEELVGLQATFDGEGIALTVIGFQFRAQGEGGIADDALCGTARTKVLNEMVLHGLCAALGPPSQVMHAEDVEDSLDQLRCRRIRQQALCKYVLRIGDIRMATEMFTLAKQEGLPAPLRCTRDGAGVVASVTYETTACNGLDKEQTYEVDKSALVKAHSFGMDHVLCSEADDAAMIVRGVPALEALAFVPESEVEPYVLMGGTWSLLPHPDDTSGQRGYRALVEAMEATGKAMLVRMVRKRDAAPLLCGCFVQPCGPDGSSRCLAVAPLPFAEEARALNFSEYPEFTFTEQEESMMDELIEGLSVEDSTLAPQHTFNPVLQQYYSMLKAKLIASSAAESQPAAATAATGAAVRVVAPPPSAVNEKSTAAVIGNAPQVSSLPPALRGRSTDFFVEGSVVRGLLTSCRATLEKCVAAFPYEESGSCAGRLGSRGRPWFRRPAGTAQELSRAPSTTAASVVKGRVGGELHDEHHTAPPPSPSVSTSEEGTVATEPHIVNEGAAAPRVTVLGKAVVQPTCADKPSSGRKEDLRKLILNELSGDAVDFRVGDCLGHMSSFRRCCLDARDIHYYNHFLEELKRMVPRHTGAERLLSACDAAERAVGPSLSPITANECPDSLQRDIIEATFFLENSSF